MPGKARVTGVSRKAGLRALYITAGLCAGLVFLIAGCSPLPNIHPPIDVPEGAGKSLYTAPSAQPDYWPTAGWRERSPGEAGLRADAFDELKAYAFTRRGEAKERAGVRTDGLVVVKDGYVVFEDYGPGWDEEKPHLQWSVAKSVTQALIGRAVAEERLAVEDPAYKYYPVLDAPGYRDITIDDLLRMSSGLYSSEGYESGFLKSTVLTMLYSTGRNDMARYAATQPLIAPHGTHFAYASTTSNIIQAVLKGALPAGTYDEYPWVELFDPLGMKGSVFQKDGAGTYVGSSYVYSSTRNMAKFGLLYLHDGMWEEKRLLPEGWVAYSTTASPGWLATDRAELDPTDLAYGAQWWLNMPVPEMGFKSVWPDVPGDAFAAVGHWGQYTVVIPSENMVVAINSDDRDGALDMNKLLSLAIAATKKKA